jgi:hypothetical protein
MWCCGPQLGENYRSDQPILKYRLPTSLLPRFNVEWTADGDTLIATICMIDNKPGQIRYHLSESRIRSVKLDRITDPKLVTHQPHGERA